MNRTNPAKFGCWRIMTEERASYEIASMQARDDYERASFQYETFTFFAAIALTVSLSLIVATL